MALAVGAKIFRSRQDLVPWIHFSAHFPESIWNEWCAGLNPQPSAPEQLPEALRLRITYFTDPCGWPHASDTPEFCEHSSALCVRLPPPGVASPHTPGFVVPGQWPGLFPLSYQDPSSSEGCSVVTTFANQEGPQKGMV